MHYSRLENIIICALIIMMMLAPTSYMIIKLVMMIFLISVNIIKKRFRIKAYNKVFYAIFLLIVASGIWSILNALIKDSLSTESIMKVFPFHVLWPFVYLGMTPYLNGKGRSNQCLNLLVVSHAVIVLYNLYEIIALIYDFPLLHVDESSDTFRFDDNFFGIATNSLHNLVFTTPFFFIVGFSGRINRKFFYLFAALTISVNIMSSRTLLLFVNIMSLGMVYILSYQFNTFNRKELLYFTVCISVVAFALLFYRIDMTYINSSMEYYMSHFNPNEDIRFEQREVLIDRWMDAPLTGIGSGTKVWTTARGWSSGYESTYHSMLANDGIIGAGIFLLYILLIIKTLYRRVRQEGNVLYLASLAGLSSFLVGAYSNPLIGTFDRLLPIYLCLACLYIKPDFAAYKIFENGKKR